MKIVLSAILLVFAANSCSLKMKSDTGADSEKFDRDGKNIVKCKALREILVDGKCIKRRGFM